MSNNQENELNIDEIFRLFEEYKEIPKPSNEPTFLEICKYPRRRFEEICSRVLKFYFNPAKEHKLNDLFLSSLFELLNANDIRYNNNQIMVITEDNADGKRVDLVIYSPDFIIGIENKISASIYNPLEEYKKRIDQYGINRKYNLVLSLHKINKIKELEQIKKNSFIAITYIELFDIIKKNIGQYISTCNQKYLTQLFDFIQTLENMKKSTQINSTLSNFFYNESNAIESLIHLYTNHKEVILDEQKEKISEIKDKISDQTNSSWWAWQGWDLGLKFTNKNGQVIGIESNFEETEDGSLGKFEIFITTWNYENWVPYQEKLINKFPKNKITKKNNRVFMLMDTIVYTGDDDIILSRLREYHKLLNNITT